MLGQMQDVDRPPAPERAYAHNPYRKTGERPSD